MLVAPERRISSWLMTWIAAAARESFCSFFETEVTSMFISSSRLISVRSRAIGARRSSPPAQTGVAANSASPHTHRPTFSDLNGYFGRKREGL
jgi:hypothetical protein